ncbi:hypothetical protein IG631_09068 [Alternaria alternata]|nr:hypothetical protein IG631_09068 [Alternaria alternata]
MENTAGTLPRTAQISIASWRVARSVPPRTIGRVTARHNETIACAPSSSTVSSRRESFVVEWSCCTCGA